ncbi:MAG: DNA helicase-2/ATP-dependent DNA helicase PcrA, partial [bacterium]
MSEELPEHQQFLNPEQFKAVTETGGPMLILAGAGSGKTRVLTRRIAQLLHEGVDPKSILAVTFTNKAASEMKERVQELVGEAGKKVWVSTFHSSCCRILRQDIEHLGYTQRFSIYDDDDQKRIVRGLLDELNIDRKAHPPKSFLSQIDF